MCQSNLLYANVCLGRIFSVGSWGGGPNRHKVFAKLGDDNLRKLFLGEIGLGGIG